MPFKKKTKTTKSKKKVFKRVPNYKSKATINRSMVTLGTGFPKKITFTHKYMDNDSLAATAGSFAKLNYSCNGIYDPNVSGVGHQPMYFDQMTALYDAYCVIGSKIEIKVLPGSSTQTASAVGVFINNDTSTSASTFVGANENSLSHYKYLCIGNNEPKTLTHTWSAKKYFGKSPLANSELQGTSTTNPLEQSFYTIYLQALDLSSSVSAFFEVSITYIVVWKSLKDLSGS